MDLWICGAGMAGLVDTVTGKKLSQKEAQKRIRKTIERTGRFLLSSPVEPSPGDIQEYAGLPMRFVRLVTQEEFEEHDAATADIWREVPPEAEEDCYHFEVEVAD